MNYKITKDIPVIFHKGSIYDNHFIIRELANEFEGEFECLGENTEKSLSSLVDNPSDRLHNNKCADCKSSLDYRWRSVNI